MLVAAELADLYKKNFSDPARHRDAKAWIEAYPDNFVVVLVATASASLEDVATAPVRLGEMIALDMMKLGTGAAGGTKLGIAEDVVRALNVVPVGRIVAGVGQAGGVLRPLLGKIVQRIANVVHWRRIDGGLCAPIALAQAMQRTGVRLVVPLKDMAASIGRSLDDIAKVGVSSDEVRTMLQGLKAEFKEVPAGFVRNWQALERHIATTEGVAAVSLKAIIDGVPKGHRILVGKTAQGIRIFDRYGVFSSLDDLSRHYRLGGARGTVFELNEFNPIYVIRNWALDPALVKHLNEFGPLGAVVIRGAMLLTINPAVSIDKLQSDLDRFLADRDAGPLPANPSPNPPPASDVMAMHYVPQTGAMLSKVSMSYYGTFHMWPLIWDANRELIGDNPNRVPRDIYLRIMKRHVYTAAQVNESRNRSLNWKSFS